MDGLTPSAQEFVPKHYKQQQEEYNSKSQVHQVDEFTPKGQLHHGHFDELSLSEKYERLKSRACEPIPQRRTIGGGQLPVELRAYFAESLKHTLAHLKPSDNRNKEVPKSFYCVYPLDDGNKQRGAAGTCGYPTSVFKVVSQKDGLVYALRRIDNIRGGVSLNEQCESGLQIWRRVRHPNVIPLRQAFIHQRAVFLVHDYWPGAQTLLDVIIQRGVGNILPEKLLWSLFTQILTGLRAAHDLKISFRDALGPTNILISGKSRARLAGAGLVHVLEGASKTSAEESIREDVATLTRTMLMLCCMNPQALTNPSASLEFVRQRYSADLLNLIALAFQRPCDVYDLLALCSHGLLTEVDELYSHTDALEDNLCRQIENSRLNRLMIKLNLVNERPEYGKSEASAWAETGDRYILKLFRDYVFHQTNEQGQPWLDMGHILTSLNKLDLGTDEKILLTSRDGRSILVVTFADVRKCLDEAFQELLQGHRSVQFYSMKQANPSQTRPPEHTMGPPQMGHQMGLYQPNIGSNPYSQQPGMMYGAQDGMYPHFQQSGGMY